jgi:hypothetical protein
MKNANPSFYVKHVENSYFPLPSKFKMKEKLKNVHGSRLGRSLFSIHCAETKSRVQIMSYYKYEKKLQSI